MTTIRRNLVVLVALALAVVVMAAVPGSAEVEEIERVSVSSNGTEGDMASNLRDISDDGNLVAFMSLATNLVPGDTNAASDIFVRDREAGTTTRVSVRSNGAQANGPSYSPAISGNGRYVAFASAATNLVPGDTNTDDDIFVHDRNTGKTMRVSVSSAGVEGNGFSTNPAIGDDGKIVAFESDADNLVPGDTNGAADVFVRNTETNKTIRVSVRSNGAQANNGGVDAAVSGDDKVVAFRSDSNNLVANDNNGSFDAYVHVLATGATSRVSVSSNGTEGNSDSEAPAIDQSGRHVAFESASTNLVPNDTNNFTDVFVHDRLTGETIRASVSSSGAQTDADSDDPVLNDSGRFVSFDSAATNLVSGDNNGLIDVFLRDTDKGVTSRVSEKPNGTDGNGASLGPALSSSACDIAFQSNASNLVSADNNMVTDVFVSTVDPVSCETEFYVMVDEKGTVYAFPDDRHVGNATLTPGVKAVDIVINPEGTGYYVLDISGNVHPIGPDTKNYGNVAIGSLQVGEWPAAMALTETGEGYWVFTNKGKAVPFGDAPNIGDVSNLPLVGEVVDAAPYPPGFYMTGADGGVFTPPKFLGSQQVPFFGSVYTALGNQPLNKPIVTIYVDSTDGVGYSLAAGDGGMFNFESEFCGSIPGVLPGVTLNQPVVNAVPYGDCYIFFAADGGAFVFGDKPFLGSLGSNPPADPIVSGAAFSS